MVVVVVSDVDVCATATPIMMPSAAAPASRSLVMSYPSGNWLRGRLPRTALKEWGWRAFGCRAGFYSWGDFAATLGPKLGTTHRHCSRRRSASRSRPQPTLPNRPPAWC